MNTAVNESHTHLITRGKYLITNTNSWTNFTQDNVADSFFSLVRLTSQEVSFEVMTIGKTSQALSPSIQFT